MEPGTLQERAQLKGLDRVGVKGILGRIKDAAILSLGRQALEHGADFRLDHNECAEVEVRVGNPLRIDAPGLGLEFRLARAVGHERDEPTEGALFRTQPHQLRQVTAEIGLHGGGRLYAVFLHQIEQPLYSNAPLEWVVHMAQRLKP